MVNFSSIFKYTLLSLIGVMLFLPILQGEFDFAELTPLYGISTYPKKAKPTFSGWFSGKYQQQRETYLNEMSGLRNFCVRLNSQVLYSLFKKAKVKSIVIGKDNYIFDSNYIEAYTGRDCVGQDSVETTLKKLKFISDKLAEKQKQLILVLAPGKASYYPEFLPDKYKRVNPHTNYELFSKGAKRYGLNLLDANAWFRAEKTKAAFSLYPQYGIHWSRYGSVLAADSIIKTIEHLRNIDMPGIYSDGITMAQPWGVDYDIGDELNLLFKLKSFDMAYPNIKFQNDSGKTKPAVLVISDSFYWEMYDFGITKCFKNDHFWYNGKVFPESRKETVYSNQLDLENEIKKHDVIIIMTTEINLNKFGWGFVESANQLYKENQVPHSANYYKRLREISAGIYGDATWLNETLKKAKAAGIDIQEQIIKEAKWVLDKERVY